MKRLIFILVAFLTLNAAAQTYQIKEKVSGVDTILVADIGDTLFLNIPPVAKIQVGTEDISVKGDIVYSDIQLIPMQVLQDLDSKAIELVNLTAELEYLNLLIQEYSTYSSEPNEGVKELKKTIFDDANKKFTEIFVKKESVEKYIELIDLLNEDADFMNGLNFDKQKDHLLLFEKYAE